MWARQMSGLCCARQLEVTVTFKAKTKVGGRPLPSSRDTSTVTVRKPEALTHPPSQPRPQIHTTRTHTCTMHPAHICTPRYTWTWARCESACNAMTVERYNLLDSEKPYRWCFSSRADAKDE